MSFSAEIDQINQKMLDDARDVIQGALIEMCSRIIVRTPVDEGMARNNWFMSNGPISNASKRAADKSGSAAQQQVQEVVLKLELGDRLSMANILPYAAVLEFGGYPNPPKNPTGKTSGGYSTQAPAGMVRIELSQFNAMMKRRADEERKKKGN